MSTTAPGIPRLAVVWTEFQQGILQAILQQEGRPRLHSLVVREGIRILDGIRERAEHVVVLRDVSSSVRRLPTELWQLRRTRFASLQLPSAYSLMSWSVDNVYPRVLASLDACLDVELFEDGTGSYVDLGWMNRRLGPKALASMLATQGLYKASGMPASVCRSKVQRAWSLFPGAHPRFPDVPRSLIEHTVFAGVLQEGSESEGSDEEIPDGCAVYLPSPYADSNLTAEGVERAIHVAAIRSFLESRNLKGGKLFWRPHPRANLDKEQARVRYVSEVLGLPIQFLHPTSNVEHFALRHRGVRVCYFSVSSSSLYALYALSLENADVVAVDVPAVRHVLRGYHDVMDFFRCIGMCVCRG